MGEYVYRQQKKMRRGLTTGTCSAAAAQAATVCLLTGAVPDHAVVGLPNGERKSLIVQKRQTEGTESLFDQRQVTFFTHKDAGDDPDVTNGTEIAATVRWLDEEEESPEGAFLYEENPNLVLTGGRGVGIVTKPGLEQEIGQAAINRVPRQMIFETVNEVLQHDPEAESRLLITISVPEGERLAERTFNPQLGIKGGISILGTSGIVEPMSEAALVATIELEIRQVLEQGQRNLVFVPGNYGQKYAREQLRLDDIRTISCSNYIGEAIDLAVSYGAESILLVGNLGKLVKLAAGIMNTHSKAADGRWEIFAAHAGLAGAPAVMLQEIRQAVTTDQMLDVLDGTAGVSHQAKNLALGHTESGCKGSDPALCGDSMLKRCVLDSILEAIGRHLKRRAGQIPIGAVLFSEKYGWLGQTKEAGEILRAIRADRERGV